MAILNPAEVRNSNPVVLVLLVWVRWSKTCLRGECKLGDTVCRHLLRVRSRERVRIDRLSFLEAVLLIRSCH